jgi:lycopene cyclase domain-containing protein
MTYSALCVVAVGLAVVLDLLVLRTRLLVRRVFWVSYAIILFFQLLTNGWLTGLGVVRYDAAAMLGGSQARLLGDGRLLYAPVEDIAFGFALVLQTLAWWVFWGRRGVQRDRFRPPARASVRRADGRRRPARDPAGRRRRGGAAAR